MRGDGSCPELSSTCTAATVRSTRRRPLALLDRDAAGRTTSPTGRAHFAQSEAGRGARTRSRSSSFASAPSGWRCRRWRSTKSPSLRTIHSLPHRRSGVVLGLANVRGELLVCVSLGQMLRLGETAAAETGAQAHRARAPAGDPPRRRPRGVSRRRSARHPSLPSARIEGRCRRRSPRPRPTYTKACCRGTDTIGRLPRRPAAVLRAEAEPRMSAETSASSRCSTCSAWKRRTRRRC